MQFNQLQRKTQRKRARQVGRGGTRGKTAGRGTKGQKARSGHKIRPEIRDMIKKMPKLRGRGSNFLKSIQEKAVAINLSELETAFKAGDIITPRLLADKGFLIKKGSAFPAVKILSNGDLTKKLIFVGCLASLPAKAKIEKAGGEVRK